MLFLPRLRNALYSHYTWADCSRQEVNIVKPEVPMPPSDQGRGRALAGFWCGLGAIIASVLAGIFTSGAVPGRTSGEGALLFVSALQ